MSWTSAAVALKLLPDNFASDPHVRDRFQREACAASALNHPNICTVHDIGEGGRRAFIALEFLDGKTLKEVVQEGPLETSRLVSIAIPALDGLEAAHAEGIIHRDIKLSNIFLSRQGQVKIVDFGLAKVTSRRYASVGVGSDAADDRFTTGGARLGTMAYMSPEQALGKALDQRTDLLSFGIVVYQMATGRAPFHGDTTGVLFLSIVQENPTPPRELNPAIPDELQRIISKCLEKGTRPRLSAGVRHTFRPESAAQRAEFELAIEAKVAEEEDRIAAVAMPGAKSRAPSARRERVTVGTLMHENLGAKPARWAWKVMATVVGLVLLAGAGGLFLKSRWVRRFRPVTAWLSRNSRMPRPIGCLTAHCVRLSPFAWHSRHSSTSFPIA